MSAEDDDEKKIESTKAPLIEHLIELRTRLIKALVAFGVMFGGGRGGPGGPPTLTSVRMQLARMEHHLQSADEAPTSAQVEAGQTAAKPLADLLQQWEQVKQTDLKALNASLQRQHLALLAIDTAKIDHDVEDQIEIGDEE